MAVKKRTATTAKKTKRASQKTTTKKKTAKKPSAGRTVTVVYKCVGGTCTPSVDRKHMSKGDTVVMKAKGTKVTIDFFRKSPFTKKHFTIASGKSVSAKVTNVSGPFPYTLACSGCLGSSVPPEFIVP